MVGSRLGSITGCFPRTEVSVDCGIPPFDVLQGFFEVFKFCCVDVAFVVGGDMQEVRVRFECQLADFLG